MLCWQHHLHLYDNYDNLHSFYYYNHFNLQPTSIYYNYDLNST